MTIYVYGEKNDVLRFLLAFREKQQHHWQKASTGWKKTRNHTYLSERALKFFAKSITLHYTVYIR